MKPAGLVPTACVPLDLTYEAFAYGAAGNENWIARLVKVAGGLTLCYAQKGDVLEANVEALVRSCPGAGCMHGGMKSDQENCAPFLMRLLEQLITRGCSEHSGRP
jgi:hypothetical protein